MSEQKDGHRHRYVIEEVTDGEWVYRAMMPELLTAQNLTLQLNLPENAGKAFKVRTLEP